MKVMVLSSRGLPIIDIQSSIDSFHFLTMSDLAKLQEEEVDWDSHDVGCPVEAGCHNGWNELQSGFYQVNHQGSLICTDVTVFFKLRALSFNALVNISLWER